MQRGALNHANVHGQGCSRRAPPPSWLLLLLLSVLTPLGATEAATAAVRHTKKNSKPKRRQRRQQNNFILFSGGRQELSRRKGGREVRGTATGRQQWRLTSLRCKCVHNAANSGSANKSAQKRSGNCRREAFPFSSPSSLCLLSSPLAFCL